MSGIHKTNHTTGKAISQVENSNRDRRKHHGGIFSLYGIFETKISPCTLTTELSDVTTSYAVVCSKVTGN